ncbi:hypothetical protein IWQ56_003049 [Coemansia nantahalensis]|uniref:Uncharacterized protein n=1 Tax=Coemansia nantahalensis TaxID=2789366 RepID=A0ACC1JX35_9FUNG|nr:hypothetical protein IWQ56_003049 [Coemansia nantahalensis]KAJ2769188.1 hypothetical protein IWQ57_003210 [Coemansia nantahalensis]
MGKRKSSRKVQAKKVIKLETSFTCLHCNHEKSVTVKIDKDMGIGTLRCKVCGQTFQSRVTRLEGAVDVYAEWVDACERVNREGDRGTGSRQRGYSDDEAGRSSDDDNGRGASRRRRSASPGARPSAARDAYGVPAQLSDDDSEIDDF